MTPIREGRTRYTGQLGRATPRLGAEAAPRPLAHRARRRLLGQQLPAGPLTPAARDPGATGRAVGRARGANGHSPRVPALLAFPPPRLASLTGRGLREGDGHRQARQQREAPPAPRPHRYRGEAGTVQGAVTARRLLCAAAGAAGPGEPLGAGGRGSRAGGGGWAVSEQCCPAGASPGRRGQRRGDAGRSRRGAALVSGGRDSRARGGLRASSPRAAPGTSRTASGKRKPRRASRQRERGGEGQSEPGSTRPAARTARERTPLFTVGQGDRGGGALCPRLLTADWLILRGHGASRPLLLASRGSALSRLSARTPALPAFAFQLRQTTLSLPVSR